MKHLLLFTLGLTLAITATAQATIPKHKNQKPMESKDYSITILVNKSAAQAFEDIKNFRGWWSEDIDGPTDRSGETFFYHYKDVHRCKLQLVEAVPGKKLAYKILDNEFSFTKDKTEWINTELIFDLTAQGGQTKIQFTHKGLVPEYECYNVCHDAWTGFIGKSLKDYINTGKGQPNPKDGTNDINAENIKKWDINRPIAPKDYTFSFHTNQPPAAIFAILRDPKKWWKGLFDEEITGKFAEVGDEFEYKAGHGAHYSVQKVTELVPNQKIAWLITKSNLSFLDDKNEWAGTSIIMTINTTVTGSEVTFQHKGLLPGIECYGACSGAWTQYMENLKKALN